MQLFAFENYLYSEVCCDIIWFMKKCTRCKKEKLVEDFNFKIKAIGLRQLQCKECTRLLIKNHYNTNKQYYLLKARKRNKKLREMINNFLCEYLLKNPCVDCGESDITVLEFDHKGIIPKLNTVSYLSRVHRPIAEIQTEIDKCEVRCANCHKKKTARDFKWFKNNNALVAQRIEHLSSEQGVGGSIPSERTE